MELRPATKEDHNTIFEIFAEIQSIHYNSMPNFFRPAEKDKIFYAYFDEVIENKDKHLIIGIEKGKPFGYIYYLIGKRPQNIYRKEKRIIYINQIVVKKAYQGRGFGSELINHVFNVAKKEKIAKIGLDVWLFNKGAIIFFCKQGFTTLNQVMWHTISDED